MSKPLFGIENLQFLVVDEDRHMRATLCGVIRQLGCRNVRECEDGEEALYELENGQFDIILTEWNLPKVNGLDLVRKIRADHEKPYRAIPIIMISAHSKLFEVEQARDAGVTEFLVKPVNSKSIFARIAMTVERPRPMVISETYIGPCRRRKHDPFLVGQARRELDQALEADGGDVGDINDDEINAMLGL